MLSVYQWLTQCPSQYPFQGIGFGAGNSIGCWSSWKTGNICIDGNWMGCPLWINRDINIIWLPKPFVHSLSGSESTVSSCEIRNQQIQIY